MLLHCRAVILFLFCCFDLFQTVHTYILVLNLNLVYFILSIEMFLLEVCKYPIITNGSYLIIIINKEPSTKFVPAVIHPNFDHTRHCLFPSTSRRHGNFAGVHTLLRILLSSNSAVLINIITGVSPPHFDFVVYYVLCQC
jgi:hypothetical protein